MELSIDCARFHCDQHAHSEVILKENKTDDVICLHFGVHVYICGHMIPSSEAVRSKSDNDPYYKGFMSHIMRKLVFRFYLRVLNKAYRASLKDG